ncbi:hypothetical protein C2I27_22780, partial [Priestia megaterium]
PQSFHDDTDLQEHVKTAYHILRGLLDQRGVKGTVRDALVGTTLLCDIMQNEFEEDMRPLHSSSAKIFREA